MLVFMMRYTQQKNGMRRRGGVVATLALVALLAGAGVAVAEDVDPNSMEFRNFATALVAVQDVQESVQEEIQTMIASSPLDDTRFMEIHQEVQTTGGAPATARENEIAAYQEMIEGINDLQMESQQEMISAVQENGLTVPRFNELVMAIQQDPELQEALANLQ